MRYHSTRNKDYFVDSAQAVLEGLAPDGGLYVPEELPRFDWDNFVMQLHYKVGVGKFGAKI